MGETSKKKIKRKERKMVKNRNRNDEEKKNGALFSIDEYDDEGFEKLNF